MSVAPFGRQIRRMIELMGSGVLQVSDAMKGYIDERGVEDTAEFLDRYATQESGAVLDVVQAGGAQMPIEDLDRWHHRTINYKSPGVYLLLIYLDGKLTVYGGSSYGEYGVQNRVSNMHCNSEYRKKQLLKKYDRIYAMMETPGARYWSALALAFPNTQKPQGVLLGEAVTQCLFGTHRLGRYRQARLSELGSLPLEAASNAHDNLLNNGNNFDGACTNIVKREATYERALQGGRFNVIWSQKNKGQNFCFCLGKLLFTVPVHWVKAAMGVELLKEEPWLNCQFDIKAEGVVHPHRFVVEKGQQGSWRQGKGRGDAYRLGIRVWREVNGATQQTWLQRKSECVVREANSIVAWLTDQIPDVDAYVWPEHQYPLVGRNSDMGRMRKRAAFQVKREAENAHEVGASLANSPIPAQDSAALQTDDEEEGCMRAAVKGGPECLVAQVIPEVITIDDSSEEDADAAARLSAPTQSVEIPDSDAEDEDSDNDKDEEPEEDDSDWYEPALMVDKTTEAEDEDLIPPSLEELLGICVAKSEDDDEDEEPPRSMAAKRRRLA